MSYEPLATSRGAPTVGIMYQDDTQTKDMIHKSVLDEADGIRNLKSRKIDWQTFRTINVLSADDLPLLKQYSASMPEDREELLGQHAPFYLRKFKKLLAKISSLDNLKAIITLLVDIIEVDVSNLQLLEEEPDEKAGAAEADPAWAVFTKLLELPGGDPYLKHQASHVLSLLVTKGLADNMTSAARKTYLKWIRECFVAQDEDTTVLALSGLMRVLRSEPFRHEFFAGGIACLPAIAVNQVFGVQPKYQTIFCLWLLSFNPHHAANIEAGTATIPAVSKVLREAMKDKVKRIAVAYLRNIVEKVEDSKVRFQHTAAMVSHKLLPVIERMALNNAIDDEEGVEDSKFLLEVLKETYEHMSSFDEYSAEVLSGVLEWTPVHRSERFWRENAMRLSEDKNKLLKVLVQILQDSQDKTSVAVAAHDLGEYCRIFPRGRQVLDRLGAKATILGLLKHDDGTVRYETLICLQKMMTSNWEFLGEKTRTAAGVDGAQE